MFAQGFKKRRRFQRGFLRASAACFWGVVVQRRCLEGCGPKGFQKASEACLPGGVGPMLPAAGLTFRVFGGHGPKMAFEGFLLHVCGGPVRAVVQKRRAAPNGPTSAS